MDFDGPSLDELIKREADAFEGLNQAFIKHSLARNSLLNHLREMRENQPNLFTGEWNFNDAAMLFPID